MATFLVTSHGRSGTKWLARELNRSKVWTVDHEAERSPVGARFWGNVDSTSRHSTRNVAYSQLAVIVRAPLAIARSCWFKHAEHARAARWKKFIEELPDDLHSIDRLLRLPGTLKIDFDKMTTNASYLMGVAWRLGVDDLDESKIDFAPTNSSSKGYLTQQQVGEVIETSKWFSKRWI